MTRSTNRTAAVATLVVLLGTCLLATAVSPATAQHTEDVDATVEYHLEPDDPDVVRVETTVENPDAVEEPVELEIDPETTTVTEAQGLREAAPGRWVVDDADEASLAYDVSTDAVAWRGESSDDGSWAAFYGREIVNESDFDVEYEHVPASGVAVANDLVYLDVEDVVTVTESVGDDGSITVVGAPERMADDPELVAEATADLGETIQAGPTGQDVTALALPQVDGRNGFAVHAIVIGATPTRAKHATQAEISVFDTGSTWFHEYVHTVDNVPVASDMEWYREAYADYGAVLYGTEAGYQDFEQYRTSLESWSGERVVLADEDAWRDTGRSEEYNQGARVLAAVDYGVRDATDGRATFHDVVEELHARDERIDLANFTEVVADVAGDETLASDVETWITTTDPVFEDGLWSHAEHERRFGDVADVSREVEDVALVGDRRRSVSPDEELAATTDQTLEVNVSLHNDGSADVRTGVRTALAREGTPVAADSEPVTLAPGEARTVTVEVGFDEAGYHDASVGPATLTVEVVEADASVVSTRHQWTADPADPAHLGDADELVVHANDTFDYRVETLGGERVAEGSSGIASRTARVDAAAFDRSTTYAVTYDTGNRTETRYVTTLDRVGSAVPVDVNGDGLHRDFNGDGSVTQTDVSEFFSVQHRPSVQNYPGAYDFNGDGDVSLADVITLFENA